MQLSKSQYLSSLEGYTVFQAIAKILTSTWTSSVGSSYIFDFEYTLDGTIFDLPRF